MALVALSAASVQVSAQLTALGLPQQEPSQSYVLRVSLDDEAHTVSGDVTITFTNTSGAALDHAMLHLYMNAFADDGTVFMTESGGQLRGRRAEGHGHIELDALTVSTNEETPSDRLASVELELVEGDKTQARVPLGRLLAPGESATLNIGFVTHLPPVFARAGYKEGYHLVAQFFPKLAKLERDGFASFPYHGFGEFYSDFANYDVTIEARRDVVIGATGTLMPSLDSMPSDTPRVAHQYKARWVHDFAFTAWDEFDVLERDLDGLSLRVLYGPGYSLAASRHADVVELGLKRFGELLGPYPYETLTVVVPPSPASGSAGMEYPTFFAGGGPWFAIPGLTALTQDPVAVHELGHQWFQGMVATNEVEHPMLDEGMTQWLTMRVLHELDHAKSAPLPDVDPFALWQSTALRKRDPAPTTPASEITSMGQLGRTMYGRVPLLLESVARTWGAPKLEAALRTYFAGHRFAHPTPSDLYRAFDDTYWPGFSASVLEPALERGLLSDVELIATDPSPECEGCLLVTAERSGYASLPLDVECVLGSDEHVLVTWPAGETRFEHTFEKPCVRVTVDPWHKDLLDVHILDQTSRVESSADGGFLARMTQVAQLVLAALAS